MSLKLEKLLEAIGEDKINLFKFIINPNDFAQSVENMFHLSFLIRDGKVALEMESAEPMICKSFLASDTKLKLKLAPLDLCSEPTDVDYQEGLKKQQIVFELDMPTWRVSSCILCRDTF